MCGRLSQYTGLHEFVDALSMTATALQRRAVDGGDDATARRRCACSSADSMGLAALLGQGSRGADKRSG